MRTDPTDNGGLFVARRPGTKPIKYDEAPTPGTPFEQRRDRTIAGGILALMIFINLLFWGPIPVGWLWVVSHIPFLAERVFLAVVVAFVGILLTLMAALALLEAARPRLGARAARVRDRPAQRRHRAGLRVHRPHRRLAVRPVDDLRRRTRRLAEPADLMGLLDHYKQFEELSDEEVSARLREEADERRRTALARVDDLDLSRTTWPDYPPSGVVNAITFVARAGLHRYTEGSTELRAELALAHDVEPERIAVGDGASQLLASRRPGADGAG